MRVTAIFKITGFLLLFVATALTANIMIFSGHHVLEICNAYPHKIEDVSLHLAEGEDTRLIANLNMDHPGQCHEVRFHVGEAVLQISVKTPDGKTRLSEFYLAGAPLQQRIRMSIEPKSGIRGEQRADYFLGFPIISIGKAVDN